MSRTLQPDDKISHYRIVGPLGAGGMGEVYVAQDETLGRNVALKILPPRLVRNEERLRRFVTEARSASSLNHPNIVTIHEIGHDQVRVGGSGATDRAGTAAGPSPGTSAPPASEVASSPLHYISMELITGETLGQKIHEDKADLRTLLGYLAQAAEGVAKAHAAGIVHRDLKPANIMITQDGFAKVLDFGLAKLTEKQSPSGDDLTSAPTEGPATDEGVVLGTVGYMSPEQVLGKAVDHRSDIFSMGCILYEAATRRRPFVADTDVEIMQQILRERPAAVEELNPAAPAEVRRLIRRCLAKSPDQRFQSMKDLAIDLREVVEQYESLSPQATSAGTLTSGSPGTPPLRRWGSVAAIVAAAVLGIGGLSVGIYSYLGGGGSQARSGAEPQQMRISVLMSRSDLKEAVLSADGRYLAFVASTGDRWSLNVRQVRTGSDAEILAPQAAEIQGIVFSRDGDYLYFRNQDPQYPNYGALFQVASLGGAPRKVAFDVDSAATLSPDGKRFCFRRRLPADNADSLVIVEPEKGLERELIRIARPESFANPFTTGAVAWSPDGARIAVAVLSLTGGAHSRIAVIGVESGKREWVGSQAWLFVDSLGWLPDGKAIMLSVYVLGSGGNQVYRLSYPGGEVRKLTNDLDGYRGVSLSSDGAAIAAIRRTDVTNIWVASPGPDGSAQPITFASGSVASVEFVAPLADGGVAFTAAGQEDRGFLWRMEPDGSGRRQLTTEGVYVFDVKSTKGAGLVFTQVEVEAILHLYRMDPDGGGLRRLTGGGGEQLIDVAPDGSAVLFQRFDDPAALWSLSLSGGEPRLLASKVSREEAAFSPDGQRVLLASLEEIDGHLYPRRIIVPSGGGAPLGSFLLPPGATETRWTPDGRAVTYVDRDKGFNLMRQPIAGGEATQVTRFEEGRLTRHEWSPDGRVIALARHIGERESLWTLPAEGGTPQRVTEFKTGAIGEVVWSLDSKSVVFTYGTSSQDVVLITDFR